MTVVTKTRMPCFDVYQGSWTFACGRGILVALHISYRWAVLVFQQPPKWLILVRGRAAPDNMVFSGSDFGPKMYFVKTRARGNLEDGHPDLQCWLVGREL